MAQAFAVLALVLFGFVPTVEAATCASEPLHAVQAQAFGADEAVAGPALTAEKQQAPAEDPKGDFKHADACMHGHCHHSSAGTPAAAAPGPTAQPDGTPLLAGASREPPTIHPAFPKRPPRV